MSAHVCAWCTDDDDDCVLSYQDLLEQDAIDCEDARRKEEDRA